MTDDPPIHLVFMLEEESAGHLLKALLPKILPSGVSSQYIPHQGKSDLRSSIPRKLQAWRVPHSLFVILIDLDSNPDCVALKDELCELCSQARGHAPLIRIACRELEAWYFGDLNAVQKAFPRFKASRYENKSKYRDPDAIVNPSAELKQIVKGFSKGSAAKKVPRYMDVEGNTSASFNNTITGIRNLVATHRGS